MAGSYLFQLGSCVKSVAAVLNRTFSDTLKTTHLFQCKFFIRAHFIIFLKVQEPLGSALYGQQEVCVQGDEVCLKERLLQNKIQSHRYIDLSTES